MKTRVEYRPYCLPFLRPVQTAHGLWRERRGEIARWVDGGGAVRYAESAPLPGRSPFLSGGVSSSSKCTAPELKDTSPREVAALLPAGRAALEVLRARRSEGFRTFKWKVGVARDPAEELDILEELCAELGDEGCLRLDANGGWTQRVAEQWLTRCAEPRLAAQIEFIEQPIWAGANLAETARRRVDDTLLGLSADYPTPLALDESLAGGNDVLEWLERGWRGFFVIKPILFDEPAAVLRELGRAKARVVFSSAMETAVGAKDALRWAFAWEGERYALGFGVYPLFKDTVFNGPSAQPFLRWEDVEKIDEEVLWNALG